MSMVNFQYADRQLSLRDKNKIKSQVALLFKKERVGLSGLNYVFCSDEYLLDINKRFLQHDYYTDIITFGLSEKGKPVEAEIYISVDRVQDNARELGISFREEMLRVIFHGALHLCGYRDKTKAEVLLMRVKENSYLRMYEKSLGRG